MKLLDSFDTKLDEKELLSAIKEHGSGNAILTKKHRFFLLKPMMRMLFALLVFGIVLWFLHSQFFFTHLFIFWIMCSAYSGVTLLWIIHSLVVIVQCIKKNKVYTDTIDVQDLKSWAFETYIKHSVVSFILQIVLFFVNAGLSILIHRETEMTEWMNIGIELIVNLLFLRIIIKTIYYIIDYEMDFNIFTPTQFVIYRQHGIFKAGNTNIATSTVKIIKASNANFFESLFGYGDVTIQPEGNIGSNPLELHYVTKPKILAKKLNDFIEESKKLINIPIAS